MRVRYSLRAFADRALRVPGYAALSRPSEDAAPAFASRLWRIP